MEPEPPLAAELDWSERLKDKWIADHETECMVSPIGEDFILAVCDTLTVLGFQNLEDDMKVESHPEMTVDAFIRDSLT